jgi:hypothetical protein
MLGLQKRGAHQAPAAAAPAASASASASSSAALPGSGSAVSPGSGSPNAVPAASASGDADAGAPRLMDRPLRVIALGWDLAAPGVLANGGAEPSPASDFSTAGLDVRIAVAPGVTSLEAALARGGDDKEGADIAILPLPTFVASYERLRALTLNIFFVMGWSRGHEGIAASKPDWPAKGDVKLAGAAGDPATFLALWAFDLTGIPASQVKLAAPSAPVAEAPFAAVDRSSPLPNDTSRSALLLTTADAPRLVPYVAVAPAGLIEQRSRALIAWATTWLKGARKLAQDAPAGARTVAATKGAPEPIALLQTLGQSSPATLSDNVRVAGLSGRSAITLEALFQRSWALWRAASVLATPSPEAAPIVTGVISALARAEPAQAGAPDDAKPREAGANAKVLLTYRQPDGKLDEAALVATAGFLAGVFERAPLRLAVSAGGAVDKARTKKAIEDAQGRFGLPAGRITAAAKPVPQAAAAIEVLSVP